MKENTGKKEMAEVQYYFPWENEHLVKEKITPNTTVFDFLPKFRK